MLQMPNGEITLQERPSVEKNSKAQETVHKNVSGLYSLSPYIQSVRNLYESTYAIKRT